MLLSALQETAKEYIVGVMSTHLVIVVYYNVHASLLYSIAFATACLCDYSQ